jgi:chaperonin GroEL (HSP60 family)
MKSRRQLKVCSSILIKQVNIIFLNLVANALEVIPRTLAQNCGAEVIRVITDLRAKHADSTDSNKIFYGVNGLTGKVENMRDLNVWDTLAVKKQTLKTSVEVNIFFYFLVSLYDFKNR